MQVEWFALHAHVFFDSTIDSTSMTPEQQQEQRNPRGGHWAAAYGAWLQVYQTSIQQNLAVEPVQLDKNGTASLMVVMNSSYTLLSYYDTDIPRHSFGEYSEGRIQLLEPATVRAKGPAHHYLPATMVCLIILQARTACACY